MQRSNTKRVPQLAPALVTATVPQRAPTSIWILFFVSIFYYSFIFLNTDLQYFVAKIFPPTLKRPHIAQRWSHHPLSFDEIRLGGSTARRSPPLWGKKLTVVEIKSWYAWVWTCVCVLSLCALVCARVWGWLIPPQSWDELKTHQREA